MARQIRAALALTILFIVLTGVAYPLLITGAAQAMFPWQANGSIVQSNGTAIGSALIGQRFSSDRYFHGRSSAAGSSGYDAMASGGSNLGPTSAALISRVAADVTALQRQVGTGNIPADLATASASGLDPHLSPAAVMLQIPRVAQAREMSAENLKRLVDEMTEIRTLGILGEPRVNVLRLNFALDANVH